jgi:drug/metabolite transporter (DMT)-like permease
MNLRQINRVSGIGVIALSLTALLTVLSGYMQPAQFSQPDEGTGAHIFQLSIAALVPMNLLFVATAHWKQPSRIAGLLAFAGVIVALAFAALYYGERYYR